MLPPTVSLTFGVEKSIASNKITIMAQNDNKDASDVLYEPDEVKGPEMSLLKLDARGVPLVPQPSDSKADPLVYILTYLRWGEVY